MNKQITTYSDDLWDITDIPIKTTLADWFQDGVRIVIKRANSSMCTYLGVPDDHPLAGRNYNDVPLPCHGDLTFSNSGDGDYLPKGYYFYGYDYAHSGDYTNFLKGYYFAIGDENKWTLGEVKAEAIECLDSFVKLMKIAGGKKS